MMKITFACSRRAATCGLAVALLFAILAGCSGKPGAGAAAAQSGKLPVVSVSTVQAQKRDFPVLLEATGTVTPVSSVDVRSQLTSVIGKVHFREGQFVKAGAVLFTLDARSQQASLNKALAQLAKDNAALADARRLLRRNQQLLAQGFISQAGLDTAQTQVDAMVAQVNADRAAVQDARVILSYARITAPGSGRAGSVNVFAGSSVQANLSTLVTITQLDPVAVAFNLPQRDLSTSLTSLKGPAKEVTATLPDGGGSFTGQLQFVDNAVDLNSGTVKVKALFKNSDAKLWPGAFVTISMLTRTLKDVVVVPQATIIQGARGDLVYSVVDGKATVRPVKVLYAQGLDAAVTGVAPGEKVVLDGRQNLRPGAPVKEIANAPASSGAL
ncbi:multidrug resistance protein MdtA precursor [mine drainage metagenome]|uniref:Multidrug resistance protein MdtA n=1 Tax=mine drainage metagenome TaxID=410659 RepID=A0A1J5Q2R4_9ZZZZ